MDSSFYHVNVSYAFTSGNAVKLTKVVLIPPTKLMANH